jgi:hypothetical protein
MFPEARQLHELLQIDIGACPSARHPQTSRAPPTCAPGAAQALGGKLRLLRCTWRPAEIMPRLNPPAALWWLCIESFIGRRVAPPSAVRGCACSRPGDLQSA